MVLLICIQLSWKTLNHRWSSSRRGRAVLSADLPVVECRAWVQIPLETYFHFEFSLPSRSEQLSEANTNEIKHDHSPVIVDLDPSYDFIIQDLVYL